MTEIYHAFPEVVQDKLLGMILALGAELWVVKDRLSLLEQVLKSKGIETRDMIDELAGSSDHVADMQRERDAFMERFMRTLTQA
ncbi:MAG TPA: hypothetical protein VOA41_03275 [Candidatus Dormibacteraeota bacterium]|nr:hypothetical protein [Candidatus Dormibacteraeota bacterium]